MLCNECAANLRDGNCWEVLMSSFVLGRIQDCDDLRGPKLCMIKDLQAVFHKLNRSVNVRLTPSQQNTVATNESSATNCFAQAEAQSVED